MAEEFTLKRVIAMTDEASSPSSDQYMLVDSDSGAKKMQVEKLMVNEAPAFSTSETYAAGDIVIYNAKLYVFTAAHAAGAWIGTDAQQITLGGFVSDVKSDLNDLANVFSDEAKLALVTLLEHVGFKDGDGQDYIDALEEALHGEVYLKRITVAYDNTVTIYTTDDLDDIKNALTVTGVYSDNTTAVIPATDYTIESEMLAGASPCTVTYSGKTAEFNATITAKVYTIANSDIVQGGVAGAYPYHNSNTNRVGYYGLGLPLKPGAKYKIEYSDNSSGGTVDVGVQRYLSPAYDAIVAHQNIDFAAWQQSVSGWNKSGLEFMAETDQTLMFATFRDSASTTITPALVTNLVLTCIAGNLGV